MSDALTPGIYRHYKGGEYELIGIAQHTETSEKMVLYRSLQEKPDLTLEYGPRPLFVRPYAQFVADVEVDGERRPRFVRLGES